MEFITKIAEYGFSLLIVLAITAAVVFALGTWMQNNSSLQAHRNNQRTADIKAIIAKDNAR